MPGLKVVVAALGVGWLSVGTAGPAAADCSGPTIEHTTGSVDRGDRISIYGTSFGTNCYDTGPPPAGEGTLGKPVQGVEIAVVQGDLDIAVAEGNANRNYEFLVEVPLPAELQPGDVTIEARWRNGGPALDATNGILTVSDAAAEPGETEVQGFGSSAEPAPEGGEGADSDGTSIWAIAAAGAVAAIIGGGATTWWIRRSRAAAATATGD